MTSHDRAVDRRWVLGTIGIGAAAGLAGCLGSDEDDEPEEADGEDGDDGDGGDAGEPELAEPVDFPPADTEEGECAVCSMYAVEHPEWNAQLVHEDENRAYFCSSGCMSAYYVDPEHFDGPDSGIENVWVTEYGADVEEDAGEDVDEHGLIDAADAYFVRVTENDDVDDIMKKNPVPFADRENAEAFVEDFEEYDDEDVITLEDFDRELAELYRAPFFEEDGDGDHDG